ncbi:O-antigen ligase family protein [Halochromatium roseum]|uniref:O-antigen ligase family protein n=1 Tax=Halochromatium roseum TaxID=391920 RepID=UPI00191429AC|nr:O-antigen ligase family protein [Halochromatium roseum]MBK5940064.1 hypothetical protein [Halochromatium roseum]
MLEAYRLAPALARRTAPPRGLPFWVFAAVLLLSPLPFASVYPVWPAVYGVLIALAVLALVLQRWRLRRGLTMPQPSVLAASLLALAVIGWGFAQSLPGLLPAWQHPVWEQTRELLQLPELAGTLALVPERSAQVATHYLTYLAFAWLAFWQCRRSRNRSLLLKLFIAAQAAYAGYGLIVDFSGLNSILWFDKQAYQGVLTSTFVNRNNYATYAGLGILAALALMLRSLRQLLARDAEPRARLRDFVETLASAGWLLVMAALLCFLALLLTESRMGLVAFLAALTLLLLGWSLRLPSGQTRAIGLGLMSLPLLLLVINLMLSGDQTTARFAHLFTQGDTRLDAYPLIQQAIAERPWTGYGLGSFESAFRLVRDAQIPSLLRRAHNDYLELALEIGWPATLALISAFGLLLAAALRMILQRDEFEFALLFVVATVQIGLHSLVDFSMQMPAVVFAYLFLAGLAFGGMPRNPLHTS